MVMSNETSAADEGLAAVRWRRDTEDIRELAMRLGCITEDDFIALADVKQATAEAWRKRGVGPAYTRLGNRVLYPLTAVQEFIDSKIKEPWDKRARLEI